MKKLLLLILVGCLISPTVFAGEVIQVAAVDTKSPYHLTTNTNNRDSTIFGDAANSAKSQAAMATATAVAAGAVVAGLVMAFGKTKSTSSH